MLIDLHTHTYPKSDDSWLTPDALIEEARHRGLQGICITEHDNFWDPRDILEVGRRHSFPVFPGCEVTTEEGHILVFGLSRYLFGMHKAAFVRRCVEEAGGAMVVAHPYRRRFRQADGLSPALYEQTLAQASSEALFSLVDAVEVWNGRGSATENRFSHDLAQRLRLPGTGASDAHRLEDVGTYATEFMDHIRSLDDLIRELRAGRFRAVALERRQNTAQPHPSDTPVSEPQRPA